MRKISVLSIVALLACSVSLMGQKSANPSNTIKLTNKSDSIAYALGQTFNANGSLMYHLQRLGVLQDTGEVSTRLYNAELGGDKAMAKELKAELDKVKKSNEAGVTSFLKGFETALNTVTPEGNGYNTGIGIGQQISKSLEEFEESVFLGLNINKGLLLQSLKASFAEEKDLLPNSEEYIRELMEPKPEDTKSKHTQRIEEEAKVFAANLQKEGVVGLPSGVQYKIVNAGTGNIPTDSSQVEVHYEGKLVDGTVFDSSYQRGEPITLGVNQVIKGWTEVLKIMPEGSKWTVYIPYEMGYGERDMGQIPPYSNLIFDVELIKIVK